jgi:hypothetical protein
VKHRLKADQSWRWLPFTACLLVFLFAFHAKTSVYGPSLKVNLNTSTASKLWLKDKASPPRPAPVGFMPHSQLLNSQRPIAGWSFALSRVATGFTPVSSFSGLSPPLVI